MLQNPLKNLLPLELAFCERPSYRLEASKQASVKYYEVQYSNCAHIVGRISMIFTFFISFNFNM